MKTKRRSPFTHLLQALTAEFSIVWFAAVIAWGENTKTMPIHAPSSGFPASEFNIITWFADIRAQANLSLVEICMYNQVRVQVQHVLKQWYLMLREQKREKVGGRLCWCDIEGANGYEPVKVSGQGEKHVDSDDRFILVNKHQEQSTGEGRRESEWGRRPRWRCCCHCHHSLRKDSLLPRLERPS